MTIKEIPGTNKKETSAELSGVICSFFSNLTPSIIACRRPINLTLVGPKRFCLLPNKWRSYNVIKAILWTIKIIIKIIIKKTIINKD